MRSLSLLRLFPVFALVFLSVAVANLVETRAWEALSIYPSSDNVETSNPLAANIWAQTPDKIENSLAIPVDGSYPSNCSRESTKGFRRRQAGPGMCQNNYLMDREAGQAPVKQNPTVTKPVDATDMLFPDPPKSPTDEEKVCSKAPGSATHPVCAWIEWVAAGIVTTSVGLDFCRPCKFSFLILIIQRKWKTKKKAQKRIARRALFLLLRNILRVHINSFNKSRLNNLDLFYAPCTGLEHLWCCTQVISKVSTYFLS